MDEQLKIVFGVFLISLALLPAILITISCVKIKKTLGGLSSIAIIFAGIILSVQTLDFLLLSFITLILNPSPEQLAKHIMIMSYVGKAFNYIALLLLGAGLWGLSIILGKAKPANT